MGVLEEYQILPFTIMFQDYIFTMLEKKMKVLIDVESSLYFSYDARGEVDHVTYKHGSVGGRSDFTIHHHVPGLYIHHVGKEDEGSYRCRILSLF